jgi:glyceraldehyde-3-phosphate dehydrogenase/erythrose-4-phosphate dehydrogenase
MAFVPTTDVSAVDLTVKAKETYEEIMAVLKMLQKQQ